MSKKSVLYSGVLLVSLIVISLLVNQGLLQGAVQEEEIIHSTDDTQYLLGQPIEFTATLSLVAANSISNVRLVVNGPEPLDCDLPTTAGTYNQGDLTCSALSGLIGLVVQASSGSASGGTLPGGTTLPDSGAVVDTLTYTFTWTPPVNLSSPPSFSLITDGVSDTLF